MKVNLKKIPVLFMFMLPLFIFSQNDFYSGKIRIIVKDHLIIPKNELVSTDSSIINVSNYPAGIYSLKLKVEGVEVDEKMLVIY